MSVHSTMLNESLTNYAEVLFNNTNVFLANLLIEAEQAGIPSISIGELQGSFLQMLLRSMKAKYIIEIGSLAGYSALTMALVLPEGGMVHCFELHAEYAEFIRSQAVKAGLADKITVHIGAALDNLAVFTSDYSIDLVFIDADKPNYVNYLEAVLPFVRSGGIIIGDNALAWGYIADKDPDFEPENVKGIQSFNSTIAHHPLLYPACLVPLGDGMAIAVKR